MSTKSLIFGLLFGALLGAGGLYLACQSEMNRLRDSLAEQKARVAEQAAKQKEREEQLQWEKNRAELTAKETKMLQQELAKAKERNNILSSRIEVMEKERKGTIRVPFHVLTRTRFIACQRRDQYQRPPSIHKDVAGSQPEIVNLHLFF